MSVRFCRSAAIAMVAWVAVGIAGFQSVASAQVAEDKLAHVAFDIRVDKALAYLESVGMEAESFFGPAADLEVVKAMVRIYGAVQLPADMKTGMALIEVMELGPRPADAWDEKEWDEKMPPGEFDGDDTKGDGDGSPVGLIPSSAKKPKVELPVNFYVRIQFTTAKAAQKYMDESLMGLEEKEVGGEKFFVPPAGSDAPENLLFHIVDDTTFEAGTTDYLTQPSRKLFTKRLETTWAAMPPGAFRVAADLESVSSFVDGFIQMAKDEGPPAAGGMLDLVPKISTLQLGADFSADNILSLTVTGSDEQQSEELRSGIDGLLAMAKLLGGQAVQLVTGLKDGEALIAAMYDGSALELKSGLTDEQIRPFFTYKGGEVPDYDVLYR